MRAAGVCFPARFFGTAHAGRIDHRVLSDYLRSAAGSRLTEIGFHPACAAPHPAPAERLQATGGWADPLAHLRPAECALLASPALADALAASGFALGRLSTLGMRTASADRAA
jgi:hypothetical protein